MTASFDPGASGRLPPRTPFDPERWPALDLEAWRPTYQTLHRYLQIVGKLQLAAAPMMNHWWQVAMQPTARGLTTGPLPYPAGALSTFQIELDFLEHRLGIETSWGPRHELSLEPRPVAGFFHELMSALSELEIELTIRDLPVEIPGPLTPFSIDVEHDAYDSAQVERWWQVVSQAATVLREYRCRFTGKSSPVHFFWGSFDLAVSRYPGRLAPHNDELDAMTREAYAEEVMSVGFWPGPPEGPGGAAFYAYARPEPAGFSRVRLQPSWARYDAGQSLFLLPYEQLRRSPAPARTLLLFAESSYQAVARLAGWDRSLLERPLLAASPVGGRDAEVGAPL